MNSHLISYTEPVTRCFESIKRILFGPFNIGKWFALGFSAWLAALLSGASSMQGSFNTSTSIGENESQSFNDFIANAAMWLVAHMALTITLVVVTAVIGMAFYLAMLWLSSRGKFMFLDNLVHDRALVKAPWCEFQALGNSLFLWRLVLGLIVMLLVLLFLGGAGCLSYAFTQGAVFKAAAVLVSLAAGYLFLIGMLVVGYITIMLEDFVVPIMYRDKHRAMEAWSRFLVLHRAKFSKFVLYFLWRCLLYIGATMALAMIGVMTCCVGLILMSIPYIGAVITLPVSSFFRLLGPEFLRQFGDEYDIFPAPPALPDPPASA